MRVLLLEDDDEAAERVVSTLNGQGIDGIDRFERGEEALKAAAG